MPDSLSVLDTTVQAGECARCHGWAQLRLYDTMRPDEGGGAWLCQECTSSVTVTITDTISGRSVTVEPYDVAEAITPWYVDAPPEVVEVIGELEAAIRAGEDEAGPAAYLAVTVSAG